MTEQLLMPDEVARRLNIGRKALYRWAQEGKLRPVVLPGGHHRYRREDVEALVNPRRPRGFHDNEDIYTAALAAYRRDCDRHGYVYQEPTGGCWVEEAANGTLTATLENMHGVLYEYRFSRKGGRRG